MNSADITTSNAGPANTNSGEESLVIRKGKSIRYTNLQPYRGARPEMGLHALVILGDSVLVYGVNHNHVNGAQLIDRSFSIGDAATYGGMNIDYVGTIVSIGEKTITVRDGATIRRLTVGEFAHYNKDFSLAKVEARNAAWMD